MCGRYGLRQAPAKLVASLGEGRIRGPFRPRHNIAPTQPVLVMLDELRRLEEVRWGLIPPWADDPQTFKANTFNARIETVATAPAFRDALRSRRCIVFADGWYEWQRRGAVTTPFWIRRRDDAPFAFAGIWAEWGPPAREPLLSCAIVTRPARDGLAAIHERMPAVLRDEAIADWLAPGERAASRLLALLEPPPAGEWTIDPVGPRVGDVRNDDPSLIVPVAAPHQQSLGLEVSAPDHGR